MQVGIVEQAGAHAQDFFGVAVEFGPDSPAIARIVPAIANRPLGIKTVSGRIKQEVVAEVQHGLSLGLSYRQIARGGLVDVGPPGDRGAVQATIRGVQGVYEQYKTWQATRIARTEAAVAYNRGAIAAFRDAGVQRVEVVDGTDDDDCAEANGSIWTVDEADSNPIEHPNCTREFYPILE
jgi:hypothetical protein